MTPQNQPELFKPALGDTAPTYAKRLKPAKANPTEDMFEKEKIDHEHTTPTARNTEDRG